MATVLTIPTYDGSGESVHPDVIKVGSTYWMAVTPYPGSDYTKENPSIFQSSDGATWVVPDGVTNPLDGPPAATRTFSDSDLVYADGFHYFYREAGASPSYSGETIWVLESADGITWDAPVAALVGDSEVRAALLSPAVVFDGTTWRMWVVDAEASPNELHLYTAAAASGPWVQVATCTLPTSTDDIWHVDVVPFRSGYIAALNWCDSGGSGNNAYLTFAISNDGTTWDATGGTIEPGGTIERVYRGSLLYDDGWRFWYSQRTTGNVWQVLLDEDRTLPAPAPSSVAGSASAWPSFKP